MNKLLITLTMGLIVTTGALTGNELTAQAYDHEKIETIESVKEDIVTEELVRIEEVKNGFTVVYNEETKETFGLTSDLIPEGATVGSYLWTEYSFKKDQTKVYFLEGKMLEVMKNYYKDIAEYEYNEHYETIEKYYGHLKVCYE